MASKCKKCKAYEKDEQIADQGTCHLHPPAAVTMSGPKLRDPKLILPVWPIVPADGWCREFEEET